MKFFGNEQNTKMTENPYLNARRTWNTHIGSAFQYGSVGICIGLLCLMIALASVGGVIYIGSQSKIIPLVFQQDSTNNIVSMTRADHIPQAKVADYRTVVGDFITNIRLVTPDIELQRKSILKTYAFLAKNDPATAKTSQFLNGSEQVNPFNRAKEETVSVQLKSIIQQSTDTWQVDWLETVYDREGGVKGTPYTMRALVTIYQNLEAENEIKSDQLFMNPHFIFVKDYNWSKLL